MTRNSGPKLILRITPRGIIPASPLDHELLSEMPVWTDLDCKRLKAPDSPYLKAWWHLCTRTAKALSEHYTKTSVSDAILIDLKMVSAMTLWRNGGQRFEPMSLKDFTDDQLKVLVEAGKKHVATEILPGVDIEELLKTERR